MSYILNVGEEGEACVIAHKRTGVFLQSTKNDLTEYHEY